MRATGGSGDGTVRATTSDITQRKAPRFSPEGEIGYAWTLDQYRRIRAGEPVGGPAPAPAPAPARV